MQIDRNRQIQQNRQTQQNHRIQQNRRTNPNRHVRAAGMLIVLAGTGLGFSGAAFGQAAPALKAAAPAAPALTGPLADASALIDAGRFVEAKALLERQAADGGADRGRLIDLMRKADTKMRAADPVEVSLQRAELGVKNGDLLAAERWSNAVSGKAGVGDAEKTRAAAILADVQARRGEIQSLIPGLVRQAGADFEAQRYGAAKASILAVLRSGIQIDPNVSRTLENQQLRIVEIERERGKNFDVTADAGLGMFDQPGTVRRPTRPSQPAQPGETPRNQDGGPPFAGDPANPSPRPAGDAQPPSGDPAAPAAQPSEPLPAMPGDQAQPPAAAPVPPPPPAPTGDDVVRMAMRADAQRILTEADQAYDAARYSEAAGKYDLVVRQFRNYLDAGDISHAQDRLNDCRTRLESNQRGNLADQVAQSTKIRQQQAQAEYDNEMSQAEAALKAGNPGDAQDHAAKAALAIRGARDLFPQSEYAGYDTRLSKLRLDIDKSRTDIDQRGRDEATRQAAKTAADRDRTRLNERDRKVNESIDRIRALQQERKYDEALAVVDQVLFLDPNNPTALLLRDILGDIVVYRRFNAADATKNRRFADQEVASEQAMIAPNGLLDFPSDWPAKTYFRGEQSAYNEPRENRQVISDMASKRIPADFTENKLEDVLTYVQSLTGVSADVDWESLEAANIRRDSQISLKLSPLPAQTLLDRILAKASAGQIGGGSEAGWTVDRGVLVISTKAELDKQHTLVIYNIQDLLIDIPDYTDVPEIDLNSVLQQSQGGGGGTSPFRQANQRNPDRPTREQKINLIKDIIVQNVDQQGWADSGGDVGHIQELNGSLIIKNTPKNHREIVGLLSKLREIRNMQINVETKFLLVNQGWFEQIGFDLDVVFNATNNQVRSARAGAQGNRPDPTLLPSDFFDFSNAGGRRGLQRVVAGGGNRDLNPIDGFLDATTPQGVLPPQNGWSPIATSQNSLGLTNTLAAAALPSDSLGAATLAAAPALGIAGQFLDDIQVDFLITATQADSRSVQLTAPRLTFTNGQTANIFVVTQQAFVSDLQPIVGDSAVGFDPTVNVASEGVTMLCEGVISADRRYVTMNIDAGVARIDGFGRQAVTAVAGGQLVNSADTQSFIQLPTITVTRVRTTATVPDEGTVLLGGQRLVTEVEVETGVPVLSKIPILNRFFTNRVESKEEQTLLILLKPTILIQSELEEKNFPGLLDSVRTGIGGH